MNDYIVGDKVVLKDDGQVYTVVAVRRENHLVLFDLQKGDERAMAKITVMRSQIDPQKAYSLKEPQYVIYKKNSL